MIARHFTDSVGIYIHTDFDIKRHAQFEEFSEQLIMLKGIEKIIFTRYSVNASYGYLFNWHEIGINVINLFEAYFKVDARNKITVEDIMEKMDENKTDKTSSIPTIRFADLDKIIEA